MKRFLLLLTIALTSLILFAATAEARCFGGGGTPESVDEVWHVQKDLRDARSVWLLSGIQQVV